MIVIVELSYENGRSPRQVEVTVKDGVRGERLVAAVDREIGRTQGTDHDWTRWNFVKVKE